MSHALRLFWTGWLFNMKNLTLSGFFMLNARSSPVFFATIAYYMFQSRQRGPGSLLYASLGAGMMGIWSSTLFGSGGLIQWQRWQGTLEYVIGVPPRADPRRPADDARDCVDRALLARVDARSGAGSSSAFRSTSPTPAGSSSPSPPSIVSLGLLGLVLASTFVLYAQRELALEPARVPGLARHRPPGQPVAAARLDAPDLVGARSDLGHPRDSRRRRSAADPVVPIAVCLGLGLLYLAIGHFTLGYFERLARASGDAGAAMNGLRIFFIGGYLAYRALFNWIHWSMYIPTMLGGPIFQILFFAYIGRYREVAVGRVLRRRQRGRHLRRSAASSGWR